MQGSRARRAARRATTSRSAWSSRAPIPCRTTPAQYRALAGGRRGALPSLPRALRPRAWSATAMSRPGRKTDPGPAFDWALARRLIAARLRGPTEHNPAARGAPTPDIAGSSGVRASASAHREARHLRASRNPQKSRHLVGGGPFRQVFISQGLSVHSRRSRCFVGLRTSRSSASCGWSSRRPPWPRSHRVDHARRHQRHACAGRDAAACHAHRAGNGRQCHRLAQVRRRRGGDRALAVLRAEELVSGVEIFLPDGRKLATFAAERMARRCSSCERL